jgi:hypothetical protein
MQFATYQETDGTIRSGIVTKKNCKTVGIIPVKFGRFSRVSGQHRIILKEKEIIAHIRKKHIVVYPEGIIPIN